MSDSLLLAAGIAVAYASNPEHSVGAKQLPGVLRTVAGTLGDLPGGRPTEVVGRPRNTTLTATAVNPDKQFVTCLACGKPWKMLKRHLEAEHGLTPEGYRTEYKVPNAPMVAPDYSRLRSNIAKESGLGRQRHVVNPRKNRRP